MARNIDCGVEHDFLVSRKVNIAPFFRYNFCGSVWNGRVTQELFRIAPSSEIGPSPGAS